MFQVPSFRASMIPTGTWWWEGSACPMAQRGEGRGWSQEAQPWDVAGKVLLTPTTTYLRRQWRHKARAVS